MVLNVMLFIVKFKNKKDKIKFVINTPFGVISEFPSKRQIPKPFARKPPVFHSILLLFPFERWNFSN